MEPLELNINRITKDYLEQFQILEKKCRGDISQTILPIIGLKEEMFKHLKVFILNYTFNNEGEEIRFFKEIKPRLFSKLIYYRKIYNIAALRPAGSKVAQKDYLTKELDKIQHFFESNIEFYKYYRSGYSHYDSHYFLRTRPPTVQLVDSECFCFEKDSKFSTCYDFLVAKILAHDMLTVYINDELEKLDKNEEDTGSDKVSAFPKIKHTWTGTKTELVELVYAICTKGSINHGNIDIKELADYFCVMFNTDAGDYYRIYLNIRNRKESRTLYLDSLRDNFNRKMDVDDNK
jgi:hypothetical protein